MESSYGLLSFGYERQKEFERGVNTMLKEVKAKWYDPAHRNVCSMVVGSPDRPITVMCVGVKNVTLQEQRETVLRARNIGDLGAPGSATLAIVRSADKKAYPYAAVYFSAPSSITTSDT
jgi:hypothetical protein